MKLKPKTKMVIYMIAMVTSFLNAYFAYKNYNFDATIAWISAAGFSGALCGVYMEINNNDKQ
jgi:hypothetical protein